MCFRLIRYAILLTALGLCTCASRVPTRPINPGSTAIPIKVWAVLGPSDLALGNSFNVGCRLSTTDIGTIVERLRSERRAFGPSVDFVWSGQPDVVFDPALPPTVFPGISDRTQHSSDFRDDFASQIVLPNSINIFFVGDVQSELGVTDLGFTTDPAQAFNFSATALIVINDTGFNTPDGRTLTTEQLASSRALPHEMAHYLARFANRTFTEVLAPGFMLMRSYNDGEHLTKFSEMQYLLHFESPGNKLGGTYNNPNSEAGEIWDRIITGQWNNP